MTLHVSPYTEWPAPTDGRGSAVALGIFDGVHVGHRALLTRALQCAQTDNLYSVAFTFHPHPARVFRARYAPKLIEPMAARLAHFAAMGLDRAVVQPFDTKFAATSPQDFVTEVLVKTLRVRHVVVGSDFVFGYRQSGNVTLLRELGQTLHFNVHVIDPIRVDGMVASSTKVREFIRDSDLPGASALLGRPYAFHVRSGNSGCGSAEPVAEIMPAAGSYVALYLSSQGPIEGTLQIDGCLSGAVPTLHLSRDLAQAVARSETPDAALVLTRCTKTR